MVAHLRGRLLRIGDHGAVCSDDTDAPASGSRQVGKPRRVGRHVGFLKRKDAALLRELHFERVDVGVCGNARCHEIDGYKRGDQHPNDSGDEFEKNAASEAGHDALSIAVALLQNCDGELDAV